MRLSLVLGIIGALLSLIIIIIITIILPIQFDIDKKDIVSEYGCSLTLGIDKPSSVGRFEGISTHPALLPIKVYYCNVNGFDDIRLIHRSEDRPDSYEFIMRPGSEATITFLLDVSQLVAGGYMDGKEYKYKGIKAFLFSTIDQPIITKIIYEEGVALYPTKFFILSDEYILVTYGIVVDEEVKERTKYSVLEGPYTYSMYLFYALDLYITIRK
jgi:hypothetical protein